MSALAAAFDIDGFFGRNPSGDYNATVLDPTDRKVFWTFQEFVTATDVRGVQITKLRLPSPPVGNDDDDPGYDDDDDNIFGTVRICLNPKPIGPSRVRRPQGYAGPVQEHCHHVRDQR